MTPAALKETVSPRALVWVVVVTKPNQERRAKRELEQQRDAFGEGFEVYLPMKLVEAKKRNGLVGQSELIAGPFFPRYMFARVDMRMDSWKKIWSTVGVHGLLGTMQRPTCLADWVIERTKAQEDGGFIRIGLEEDAKGFVQGDRVRTLDDYGFEGVFLERVDEKRVVILVSCMGRDSRFTVDPRKLRAA